MPFSRILSLGAISICRCPPTRAREVSQLTQSCSELSLAVGLVPLALPTLGVSVLFSSASYSYRRSLWP